MIQNLRLCPNIVANGTFFPFKVYMCIIGYSNESEKVRQIVTYVTYHSSDLSKHLHSMCYSAYAELLAED